MITGVDPIVADGAAIVTINGWIELFVKPFIGDTAKKFTPLICVGMGIAYAYLMRPGPKSAAQCIASGVILGLAACGAWSGTKNGVQVFAKKEEPKA